MALLDELDAFVSDLRCAADIQTSAPASDGIRNLAKKLPGWLARMGKVEMPGRLLHEMWQGKRDRPGLGSVLLSWLLLHDLGRQLGLTDDRQCLDLLRGFGLDFAWQECATSDTQTREVLLGMLLMQTPALPLHPATSDPVFAEYFSDPKNAGLLGINRHAGQRWFAKEGLTALAGALALQAALMHISSPEITGQQKFMAELIPERLRERLARAAAVGYRLDKFLHLE